MNRSPTEQKRLILESLGVNNPNTLLLTPLQANNPTPPEICSTTPSHVSNEELDPTPPVDYTFESISKEVDVQYQPEKTDPKTKHKGLNEPQIYQPTITINTPDQDPEKKNKRQHPKVPEYDPTDPQTSKEIYNCKNCRMQINCLHCLQKIIRQ
jgi:hypothetical protein